MVRQLFFPSEGGGPFRRFLAIRKRIYKDAWNDERPRRGPVPLFDFRQKDDAADVLSSLNSKKRGFFGCWQVSDDSVIGGYSSSRMQFIEGTKSGNSSDSETNAIEGAKGESEMGTPPFLRWSGHISTQIGQSHLARNVTRSGFAAIRSPEYPFGAPLGNWYNALEICCRTDGRTYAVNLNVETHFPDDMYQGFIGGSGTTSGPNVPANGEKESAAIFADGLESDLVERNERTIYTPREGQVKTPSIDEMQSFQQSSEQMQTQQDPTVVDPSLDVRNFMKTRKEHFLLNDPSNHPYHGYPPLGFSRFILPFRDFCLTARGRMRQIQRDLDGAVKIESIGFTLMDGKDGDFTFDLVSLRALNVLDGAVVDTMEDEERKERVAMEGYSLARKGFEEKFGHGTEVGGDAHEDSTSEKRSVVDNR